MKKILSFIFISIFSVCLLVGCSNKPIPENYFINNEGNLIVIYEDGTEVADPAYVFPGDTFTLPESWIAESGESYVRVEFHEMKERPRFFGMCFRDHSTTRLISNPIWLKRKEK